MDNLLVLTFADKQLSGINYLKKSCEHFGINLEVLICSPWIQNVIKLKMLYEFVCEADDPELVLLVVDAYDVVVYDTGKQLLQRFIEEDTDVLFSGESNFMYKEPAKWLSFLRKYPTQPTIYQYLNSGTYMGRVKHIKVLLEDMQTRFDLDLLNEEKLLPVKSDQYLLSRYFVESQSSARLKTKLDAYHHLLGVTGGRFCVIRLPDITKWQSFSHFIIERNLLKLLSLHQHQKVPKDYHPHQGKFRNRTTRTTPPVMHFPGTWDRFDKVYEDLLQGKKPSKGGTWIFAALISLASYPFSILAAPLFWLMTRK